jgi:hypothetical protein
MKEFSEKDFLLLSYLEGDLSESEKAKVEAMLAEDAALMNEYRLLTKTILPAEEVTYTNKSALKKSVAPQKVSLGYLVWTGAVAAVLAVLILLYSPVTKTSTSEIASSNNTNETPNTGVVKENETVTQAITKEESKINNSTELALETPVKSKAEQSDNKIEKVIAATSNPVVEPFEKQEYKDILLAAKVADIPSAEMPTEAIKLNKELTMPVYVPQTPIENYENKGWFARTTRQINNKLNLWGSYLQKPKVEIGKKEPVGGRTYWVISVEADKYEWEGRLYTRR